MQCEHLLLALNVERNDIKFSHHIHAHHLFTCQSGKTKLIILHIKERCILSHRVVITCCAIHHNKCISAHALSCGTNVHNGRCDSIFLSLTTRRKTCTTCNRRIRLKHIRSKAKRKTCNFRICSWNILFCIRVSLPFYNGRIGRCSVSSLPRTCTPEKTFFVSIRILVEI